MLHLLMIGVAAWVVYETIRAVTPIPGWLQSILVVGTCYALTYAPPVVLTVLSAAGITSALRIAFALLLPHVTIPALPQLRLSRRESRPKRNRIPSLP